MINCLQRVTFINMSSWTPEASKPLENLFEGKIKIQTTTV
jgi:hypothetical protein